MPSANREKFFGAWPRSDKNNLNNNNNSNSPLTMFTQSAPSTPQCTPFNTRNNSPTSVPTSPISTSPTSPTLRRNYSSTFTLIPEDRALDSTARVYTTEETKKNDDLNQNFLIQFFFWWFFTIFGLFQKLFGGLFKILWRPFMITAPTFWISAWLWIFWKTIGLPLSFIKWILIVLHTPSGERSRKKRTVLISGGSTIQTLHLARNFYSAGTRVIVFDFEGLFGLARFSTAVNKFYTVVKPTPDSAHDYIAALCEIVEKEKPSYYIPVCATSPAHYDALAKPHLELLGCVSFIPGAQETSVLDDVLEVMKKCRSHGISLPPHQVLTSKDDLFRLYENNWLAGYRNILQSAGKMGILERYKLILPKNRRDLRLTQEISEERRWIVIRDLPGTHYVTCTTVKESNVIANVTCSVEQETRSLIPQENLEVEKWVKEFFATVRLQRPINGHISFRFVKCEVTGLLLPLGSRIGVSLPYICHTGVHPRVLWKPCPHFTRKNSGPLVEEGGRYWMHEAVLNTLKHPSVNAVGKLIGTVLDKREALFVYWDPLPYCAYYHFQLPFKSVTKFLQNRQTRGMTTTITAPVH